MDFMDGYIPENSGGTGSCNSQAVGIRVIFLRACREVNCQNLQRLILCGVTSGTENNERGASQLGFPSQEYCHPTETFW